MNLKVVVVVFGVFVVTIVFLSLILPDCVLLAFLIIVPRALRHWWCASLVLRGDVV